MGLAAEAGCEWCPALCATRSQIVDTVVHGDPEKARRLFILLEAPGQDEDILGEPVMGQAGRKLKGGLAQVGVRDYIVGNAIRCWPGKGNRDPRPNELDNCAFWLGMELQYYKPRVILCLGAIARSALSRVLPEITWNPRIVEGVHPAAVLRRPALHDRFMEDLARAAVDSERAPAAPFGVDDRAFALSADNPKPARWLAADIETTGTREKSLVGYSVADEDGGAFYYSLPERWGVVQTVMHDAKFDGPVLGVDLWNLDRWDDTMLLAYTMRYPELGLKVLEKSCLNMDSLTYDQLKTVAAQAARKAGVKVRVKDLNSFDFILTWVPELALRYAVGDSVATARLWGYLVDHADKRALIRYRTYEKPLVPILASMEAVGVRVDLGQLENLGVELDHIITTERAWLQDAIPGFTSSKSPALAHQLAHVGINLHALTAKGRLSISEHALLEAVGYESVEQLRSRMEYGTTPQEVIVEGTLGLREVETLKATFVDGLVGRASADWRVRCIWNQMNTPTGRLSSSDPNLQNQPTRRSLGRRVRQAFLPEPGHVWLRLDASQLELRIMADYTRDSTLLAAYPRGAPAKDVHQMAADAMRIQRGPAKNSMFEIAYGGGKERLARTAGVPLAQASAFWEHVRQTMPGLVEWGQDTRRLLESQGYLETRGGHRGYFPTYWSPNGGESAEALRSAVNFRIQGTAADIFKRLMALAWPVIQEQGGILLVQVHDELGISCESRAAPYIVRALQEVLKYIEAELGFVVPLELTASIGPSWAEQKEL